VSISPIFYEQLFCTKVFFTAFMCLQFGFVIFWQKDFGTKAAHKMLVKLTPGSRNWAVDLPSLYFIFCGNNYQSLFFWKRGDVIESLIIF
jgi:hypothetical protein